MSITVIQQCEGLDRDGSQCERYTEHGIYCSQHLKSIDNLKIRRSTIPEAGLGLFTTIDRERGTNICTYAGRIIIDLENTSTVEGPYVLQVGKNNPQVYIDAARTNSCYGRYANSGGSRRNNCQLIYDRINRKAWLRATKKIKAGSELFTAYGRSYGPLV
jgi:hypothetical protein